MAWPRLIYGRDFTLLMNAFRTGESFAGREEGSRKGGKGNHRQIKKNLLEPVAEAEARP